MERHEKTARHLLLGGATAAVVVLAAACASGTGGAPVTSSEGPTSPTSPAAPASSTIDDTPPAAPAPVTAQTPTTQDERLTLLDTWRVTGQGIDGDTWLRLVPGTAAVWRDCGLLEAGWALGPTAILAWPHQWDTACDTAGDAPHEDRLVPWLTAATSYRAAADGWQLVGADGTVLATLEHGTAPAEASARFTAMDDPQGSYDPAFWTEDPAPVPAAMVPATVGDVVGRWSSGGAATPYLDLAAGGTWTANVCSPYDGHWALDADGRLLVTSFGGPEGTCQDSPLVDLLIVTTRLALDGDHLVLLDHVGQTNAVLTRIAQ